jgi:hypothetical protein
LITKGNAYSMEIYLLDLRNAHFTSGRDSFWQSIAALGIIFRRVVAICF